MDLFGRKEKEVQQLIQEHLDLVKKTVEKFPILVEDYMVGNKEFKEYSFTIHNLEHLADEVRRKAEMKMYKGAFLPFFREDYIVLMELVDKIANKTESTSDYLVLTRPKIPKFIHDDIRTMLNTTMEMLTDLDKAYEIVNDDMNQVLDIIKRLEAKEQFIDKLQWSIIKTVFKSNDVDRFEKIILKDMIDNFAAISDRIEDVSDRLEIMIVKRAT